MQKADAFLGGEALTFSEANALWPELKKLDDFTRARAVLARLRSGEGLLDTIPATAATRHKLCQQEALCTSKDPELSASVRHDRALAVLRDVFDIDDPAFEGDPETLGIAGGIYKRRWVDLGRLEDLIRSADCYRRGAKGPLGADGYAHINAAFVEDLLASTGEAPDQHREEARLLRERILRDLPVTSDWWNVATRAEALFGLRRYEDARQVIAQAAQRPAPWELETTARQFATLAQIQKPAGAQADQARQCLEALVPGAAAALQSLMLGRVGLGLSGGGFRASFYHLGVLARLAELDFLRHIEVLSCVSGGSIVGACYWLALRRRLLDPRPMERSDYVTIVRGLIDHFQKAVATDLRRGVQPSKLGIAWRFLKGEKGALDPERTADALEREFYRPLLPGAGPLYMHELKFTPADHAAGPAGSQPFHPRKHNWLRAHKVPELVLNATTVNTGHAWQFTPTWMGESPWAVHEAADSIPRLEWAWYSPAAKWQIRLARAVAASACVPFVFAPLELDPAYPGVAVQLVDGGVHDNQGTVSLLALDCNLILVSDACGQLLMESKPEGGLVGTGLYAKRSMETLMERIRQANYADLEARRRSGLLRGLMFLHMKAGLDADTVRLSFSTSAYELKRAPLTPAGVRKEFQQALAELRTDLDAFTPNEANGLMACGYQMALKSYQRDLSRLAPVAADVPPETWSFSPILETITSVQAGAAGRAELLAELQKGSSIQA